MGVGLSGAQLAVWGRREFWTDRLHAKWRSVLSRADCEELVVDAILASSLLRRHHRADGDVVRQWWALDVKSVAVRRDARLRGAVRVDGTRRGHICSLEASVDADGAPVAATLPADAGFDPAALITEGEEGQSRRYRREQATRICETAIRELKPKYQEILRLHLNSSGEPQRVLCQRLGLTEKAYQARLVAAREQFARRVRAQSFDATCEQVRAMLGGPLGAHVPRVEAHLEDCYACRAWQLFHRQRAVAAVIPLAAVTRWHTTTERVRALVWRASPVGEVAASHSETTLGGGLAGGLMAGCGMKAASVACTVALTGLLSAGPAARTPQHKHSRTATARASTSGRPAQAPAGASPASRAAPTPGRAVSPVRPSRSAPPRATRPPRETRNSTTSALTEFSTEPSASPATPYRSPVAAPRAASHSEVQNEFAVEPGA